MMILAQPRQYSNVSVSSGTTAQQSNNAPPAVAEEVYTPTPESTIPEDAGQSPTPFKHKLACAAVVGSAGWLATNIALDAIKTGSMAGAAAVGVGALASLAAGYISADLVSGIAHHAIDNYPTYKTPIIGNTAYEFQVHHHKIHDLETQSIWTNMAAAGKWMWMPMAAAAATNCHWSVQAFALGFNGGGFLAQGSHRWTHMKNPPAIARVVQKLNLMQTREQHALHHKMPWADNYCIVNGMWNPLLSKTHFFRKWEKAIYNITGAQPHCWKDPGVKAFALGQISEDEFLKNQGMNRKVFREIVRGEFDAEFERRAKLRMEAEAKEHGNSVRS